MSSLRSRLVDARLSGGSDRAGGGFAFRTNEQAASVALIELALWLHSDTARDVLVAHQRAGADRCACGATLPLGSSFFDHVITHLTMEATA